MTSTVSVLGSAVAEQGIRDELTNWHNLLQGGLGALVGAIIAGLVAVWVARTTVKGGLEAQRLLDRESQSRALCEELTGLLTSLTAAARMASLVAGPTGLSLPAIDMRFIKPVQALEAFHTRHGPSVPPALEWRIEHLVGVGAIAGQIAKQPRPAGLLDARVVPMTNRLAEGSQVLQEEVMTYRRDPLQQLDKWSKKDRAAKRALLFARIAWRARHPLGGGVKPRISIQVGSSGVNRVVIR